MAYARWSTSDIYVYLNSNGYFCCCQCPMYDYDGKFYNTKDIICCRCGTKFRYKKEMYLVEDEHGKYYCDKYEAPYAKRYIMIEVVT